MPDTPHYFFRVRAFVVIAEASVRARVARRLTEAGLDVSTGTTSVSVTAAMKSAEAPRLVFMDSARCDVGFCSELRAVPGPRVQLVALVRRDEVFDAVTTLGAGLDDYVRWPFDARSLDASVRLAVGNARLQEQANERMIAMTTAATRLEAVVASAEQVTSSVLLDPALVGIEACLEGDPAPPASQTIEHCAALLIERDRRVVAVELTLRTHLTDRESMDGLVRQVRAALVEADFCTWPATCAPPGRSLRQRVEQGGLGQLTLVERAVDVRTEFFDGLVEGDVLLEALTTEQRVEVIPRGVQLHPALLRRAAPLFRLSRGRPTRVVRTS